MMMRISNFFIASLLTSILKVGGSVLNDETSFGLQYAATLFKAYSDSTIQTTPASQDSFCMFGHHFVKEMKMRMPQDFNFAKKKNTIELNIALRPNLFFSDCFMEKDLEGEVVRRFNNGSEMVEESAENFNAHFVNRWANFKSSQIKNSKMARKGNELSPMVLSSIVWTSANLRAGGKVAVRMKAEGKFEEAAIDLIDKEASQIQEISSARERSSARGNNTSGATGGGWQRSGGAAEESASTDADEAELEVKLLEARLKAIKAKKRAEGSKDNNRSGGAAADSHHGWE